MTVIVGKLNMGVGHIKVAIKDTINIENTITKAGSFALENAPKAEHNAEIVDHILKHDCMIIAKTNLHELAYGITGINHYLGTPVNSKYPDLIPGGSSSGSAAAVAGKLCDFSIGTDTGGSIRMPAACCGVLGFKPTFNRVSRQGVLPAQSSLDCVGPFANNIEMLIKAMQIIDPSFDIESKESVLLDKLSVAILDVPASYKVWITIDNILDKLKFKSSEIVSSQYIDSAFDAGMKIINFETFSAFGHLLSTEKLGQDITARLKKAALTTETDVRLAESVRQQFTQEINQLLERFDVLILPTLPEIPPKVVNAENTAAFLNLTALVRPFNLSGHPAISLPFETTDGLPVGLQIIGKHFQDEKLCLIAQSIMNSLSTAQQDKEC